MKRSWAEATVDCSSATAHVLSMLLDFKAAGHVVITVQQVTDYALASGHDWSVTKVRDCLEELRRADCLVRVENDRDERAA